MSIPNDPKVSPTNQRTTTECLSSGGVSRNHLTNICQLVISFWTSIITFLPKQKELSWYISMQLSHVSYEKSMNDYPHFELQNANEFRALFKIPQSHPSESWGSPTSNDLLAEAGAQSLVVNFPAHWLLIVTVDARLSGWNGTVKSIALCWLITDFPADQNALIDACSCGGSLSRAAAPGSDSRFFLSRTGPGYPHSEQEGWAIPQIWLSNVRAVVSALPPSPVH